MAIAFVADRASAGGNVLVTVVNLVVSGLTVGNTIIVRTSASNTGGGGAARSCTLSNFSGNAIELATMQSLQNNYDPGAAGAGSTVNFFVAEITATSGTMRLTYSGSVMQSCVVEEWSGIDWSTGNPVVQSQGTTGTGNPSLPLTGVVSGNLMYCTQALEGPGGDTWTNDTDTTNGSWVSGTKVSNTQTTDTDNQTTTAGWKIVTATGNQTWDPTNSVSRDYACMGVELKQALQSVGDTLQAIWDVRGALGDTVQAIWDTRAVLSDTSQSIWDVRAAVGDTLEALWDVQSSIFDPRTQVTAQHVLWADDPDWTNPGDGNPVDSWRNHSGGGDPANTGTARPLFDAAHALYNDHAVLTFAAASLQYLDFDIDNNTQPFKVLVVGNTGGADGVTERLMGFGGSAVVRGLGDTTGDVWLVHSGSALNGGACDADPHVFRATLDGVNSQLWVDEVLQNTGSANTDGMTRLVAGANVTTSGTPGNYLNGNVAFIGVYDGSVADADLEQLAADLTEYYFGGATAVGDELQTVWDVRSALGDTLQSVWNIRQVQGDTVQSIWNTRLALGDAIQALWGVRTSAFDTVNPQWSVRTRQGDTVQVLWNLKAPLSDTVQAVWNVRAALGDTSQYIWNVRQAQGDTVQVIWHDRAVLGDSVQALWNVRQALGDSIQAQWAVRAAVGDPVQVIWAVRQAAGDPLQLVWNVLENVGGVATDSLALVWNVKQALGDSVELPWSVRTALSDDLALAWGVRIALGDLISLPWNIRTTQGDQVDLQWAARALVSDQAELQWALKAALADLIALQWSTRSFVSDQVDLQWADRVSVGDQTALLWNILATLVVGDNLVLIWDVEGSPILVDLTPIVVAMIEDHRLSVQERGPIVAKDKARVGVK